MFTVELKDTAVRVRLTAMPGRVRASLYRKATALAVQLANLVRQKLSGQVLNVRTGNLRASIFEDVQQTSTAVTGKVGSSGDVKYAGIHEYGGTIPAHEIVPNKAQALAFIWQGKQQFFKRVQIPDVHMPERSYLRSSLSEMKQQIVEGLREAVLEGLR